MPPDPPTSLQLPYFSVDEHPHTPMDYAGLPSTCTSERYVLFPLMPHEVLNFKPAHASDLLSAWCAGSVHSVYNTVCVDFNMLTQSLWFVYVCVYFDTTVVLDPYLPIKLCAWMTAYVSLRLSPQSPSTSHLKIVQIVTDEDRNIAIKALHMSNESPNNNNTVLLDIKMP